MVWYLVIDILTHEYMGNNICLSMICEYCNVELLLAAVALGRGAAPAFYLFQSSPVTHPRPHCICIFSCICTCIFVFLCICICICCCHLFVSIISLSHLHVPHAHTNQPNVMQYIEVHCIASEHQLTCRAGFLCGNCGQRTSLDPPRIYCWTWGGGGF